MITKTAKLLLGKKLYHASRVQSLKELDPNENVNQHRDIPKKAVYASDDKKFAAAFCFPWSNPMGINYGSVDGGPYTLTIPKRHMRLLDKPCSIYEVSSDSFKRVSGKIPEYISHKKVEILKETRYSSARECLKKCGVPLRVIDDTERAHPVVREIKSKKDTDLLRKRIGDVWFRQEIKPNARTYIAVDKNNPMHVQGAISVDPSFKGADKLIDYFYVFDENRGKGYGKALLDRVLNNKEKFALYTGKFTSSTATDMYKRRGFELVEDFGPGRRKYWEKKPK